MVRLVRCVSLLYNTMKERVQKVIHHARSQSVQTRRNIAFISTTIIIILITIIWLLTFSIKVTPPPETKEKGTSPFGVITEVFKDAATKTKGIIGNFSK